MLASLFMFHCIAVIQCWLQLKPTFGVDFFRWSYIQNLMLSEINFTDFYVSTTESLLHIIYFRQCKKMSANHYFNHIPMDNYKREILMAFMLELLLYVIGSLN